MARLLLLIPTDLRRKLMLRNPETWWPIEQDYLLDDYLFVNDAPLPPRVDLRTGQTRVLDPGKLPRQRAHGAGWGRDNFASRRRPNEGTGIAAD